MLPQPSSSNITYLMQASIKLTVIYHVTKKLLSEGLQALAIKPAQSLATFTG